MLARSISTIMSADSSMASRKRRIWSSAFTRSRNCPICAPITCNASCRRSSGGRSSRQVKSSTPRTLPPCTIGKNSAPRRPGGDPVLGEPHDAGGVVHFPELGAIPVLGLADRPHRVLHTLAHGRSLGEAPSDRVLEAQQPLGALSRGDDPAA